MLPWDGGRRYNDLEPIITHFEIDKSVCHEKDHNIMDR